MTEIADTIYKILNKVLERIIVKRVFTVHQLAHFLIINLEKDITKIYKSKLIVITGDVFLSDLQISKGKEWLYPQMINAIKKLLQTLSFLSFLL